MDMAEIEKLKNTFPLLRELIALNEVTWFNPAITDAAEGLRHVGLTAEDVADASARLSRFAPYFEAVFPQTQITKGIIESPLSAIPSMQSALASRYKTDLPGKLMIKLDAYLPVSGSIKARGGIYEVLFHAESLATEAGLLSYSDNYAKLDSKEFRRFFSRYSIAVGSTGNLGLSIGIISATLGFNVSVHMSADARQWKKDKLRAHGVNVVEYQSDYSLAVEKGREEAENNPLCHFIDDENSTNLFLGYAVAGERLKTQFRDAGIVVSRENPLLFICPAVLAGGTEGLPLVSNWRLVTTSTASLPNQLIPHVCCLASIQDYMTQFLSRILVSTM